MFDPIPWALGSLLKGTALLLVVFVLAGALRSTSAAFRHLVWSGGILAVLLLPFVSLAVPWRLRLIAVPEAPQRSVEQARDLISQTLAPLSTDPVGSTTGERASAQPEAVSTIADGSAQPRAGAASLSPRTLALWAAGVWLAGVLFVVGRLAFGALLVRRIVRRATPLESPDWTRPLLEAADRMALDRVPRLLISDRLPIPFASGVIRPAIVLPQAAGEWSDRRRRAVLCHELAHVRRMDLPVNALAQLACAVYWFHPLVWVAARRLRLESERACDDLVLGLGTRPSEYADHLLQIVCRAARVRAPAMALPMAERREFEGRMLAILERGVRRDSPTPRHAMTLSALALALVLPLAALAPTRPAPPDPSQTANQGVNQQPPLGPGDVQSPQRIQVALPQPAPVPRQPAQQSLAQPAAQPEPDPDTPPQGVDKAGRNRRQQSQSDTSKAKVVTALAGALINDSVAKVREDAAYALGQLEATAAVMPLGAALTRDASPEVRKMAAWALGQIESRDAVTPLGAAATRDQSEEVRGMAIWALGQIEDPRAVTPLLAALTDASAEIRGRAAWALGTIEPDEAPPPLIAALRDAAAHVRVRAAWALGQIEDPRAVPALSLAMKDASPEVRRAAFWAVGQIGGDAAQPALLEALQAADPEIRAQAARALAGRHGNPWPWPWPMPIIR